MKRTIIGIVLSGLLWGQTASWAVEPSQWIQLKPAAQADLKAGSYPLLTRLEEILKQVSQVRELPVKTPVQVDTLTRDQLMEKLQENISKTVTGEQIEGEKALYVRWQMLQPEFDYKAFILELYTEQIGGFYDPETKMLYLVKGVPVSKLDLELLVAHELTHALQDQNYDLSRMLGGDETEKNDDQTLAQMAIVEGDATLTSMEYMQKQAQDSAFSLMDFMGSIVNLLRMQQTFKKLQDAPHFMRSTMLFPYEEGLQFMQHFRLQGWDWEDMSVFYQTPPRSTEMVLHPVKYLDGEYPEKRTFSLQNALPEGTTRLLHGVMGELVWQQFFMHHLSKRRQARKLAKGWHGDFFEILKLPNQTYMLNLRTVWDTEADAEAFFNAYQTLLRQRYPQIRDLGQNIYQLSPHEQAFIQLNQREVVMSEGFSDYGRLRQQQPDFFN